jgi:ABC-type cobalt transport system substrate-binding protein
MDFIKSLTSLFNTSTLAIKDRLASRFASSFAVAWIIVNWRLIYYFFGSDKTTEEKIQVIDKLYIPHELTLYWPLSLAILYILLYPFVSVFGDLVWTYFERIAKRKAGAILENKVPLFQEDKDALIRFVKSQTQTSKEAMRKKDDELESLQAILVNSGMLSSELKPNLVKSPYDDNDIGPDYELDSDILSCVNTESGNFQIREWLAQEFDSDLDNAVQKKEIDQISCVFKSIIGDQPEHWRLRELKYNLNGTSNILSKQQVDSIALKLKKKDIILNVRGNAAQSDTGPERTLKTYGLSKKTKDKLTDIANKSKNS